MKKTEDRIQNPGSRIKKSSLRFSIYIIWVLVSGLILLIYSCKTKSTIQTVMPMRIITLSPNLTEIAFALGLEDRITAVSSDSDWPAQTKDKARVGSFWQPSTELIIAQKPDLVITENFEQQSVVAENLKRLGIPVLTIKIETIEQMRQAILQIGDAANCRMQAENLVADFDNKIKMLRTKLENTAHPKVLWVVQTEPLRVAGRRTFINDILEIAGGINVIGQTLMQYPQIGDEVLLTNPADVIIQSAMGETEIAQQQKEAEKFWARQPSLPAVKAGKIYVVDSDLVLRLGPRLPEGIETIASILHPEKYERTNNTDN